MSSLRALRLLNSVEAGITDSTELNELLSDSGRLSEFSVLMSMRGQARRMAASTVTVDAFINSPIAVNAVFADTDLNNPVVGVAMLKKQTAMVLVSADRNTLNIIMANPYSAALLKASPWFETYVKELIANLTPALSPANYPSVQALVTNNAAMGVILDIPGAVEIIVASPTTMETVAGDLAIMTTLSDSSAAVNIVASSTSAMSLVAASTNAMNPLTTSSIAMTIVANKASAMSAIAANEVAYSTFLASPYFSANRKNVIASLIGLTSSDYVDINAMIDDAAALTTIASNKNAVTALASSSAALGHLATSANLSIVLNSTIAMAILGPNVTAMTAFLGNPDAWASLFASTAVKGYITSSTGLVDAIAANTDLLAYLTGISTSKSPGVVPDGISGTFQTFPGLPAKILTLSVKEIGIAATYSTFNLGGATTAGTAAGEDLRVSSTVPKVHVAAYSGVTWDFQGAGVTLATQPIVTYVDMS
jgi:hypothetical protein